MDFLRLLCENHYSEMQEYMRMQPDNMRSYNMVRRALYHMNVSRCGSGVNILMASFLSVSYIDTPAEIREAVVRRLRRLFDDNTGSRGEHPCDLPNYVDFLVRAHYEGTPAPLNVAAAAVS